MSPLDSFNNYNEEIPVKDNTGISESNDYKSPVNELREINQREKIDNLLEESKLTPEEKEKSIDYILENYDVNKYDLIINQIIDWEAESLDDVITILDLNKEKEEVITEKEEVITEKEEVITEKEEVITEKEEVITEDYEVILEKEEKYERLTGYLS